MLAVSNLGMFSESSLYGQNDNITGVHACGLAISSDSLKKHS